MKIPLRRKIRIHFLKWHRALGLFAAFFVLVIAITGFALNHGNELSLDSTPLPISMLPLYDVEVTPPSSGFNVGGKWSVNINEQLVFDNQNIGSCSESLAGALQVADGFLIVCAHQLYLLTPQGQIIEKASQLPDTFIKIAVKSDQVVLFGGATVYLFDPDEFAFSVFEGPIDNLSWIKSQVLPTDQIDTLSNHLVMPELTWERFMQDLHSGRLFGQWGVWFVDLVGVVILMLAFSGVWLRLSRPGKK